MRRLICFLLFLEITYDHCNICQSTPITGLNPRFTVGNEYLFTVSIAFNFTDREVHYCGGSLITRQHVLTSAHCRENDLTRVVIRVGSNDETTAEKYHVKSWIIYDEWTIDNNIIADTINNDISVIKLIKKVSSSIKLARITEGFSANFYGMEAKTVIWGDSLTLPVRKRLKVATLNILSHEQFVKNFDISCGLTDGLSFNKTLGANFIGTATVPPSLLENGDSGSPLFINNNEIIGINDSVETLHNVTCVFLQQNLHMAIDYYRDFIKSVTKCKTSCFSKLNIST